MVTVHTIWNNLSLWYSKEIIQNIDLDITIYL